eukprot:6212149-Pleurochrysis_carterae.AAC.1
MNPRGARLILLPIVSSISCTTTASYDPEVDAVVWRLARYRNTPSPTWPAELKVRDAAPRAARQATGQGR